MAHGQRFRWLFLLLAFVIGARFVTPDLHRHNTEASCTLCSSLPTFRRKEPVKTVQKPAGAELPPERAYLECPVNPSCFVNQADSVAQVADSEATVQTHLYGLNRERASSTDTIAPRAPPSC